jgi:hypothetical protein
MFKQRSEEDDMVSGKGDAQQIKSSLYKKQYSDRKQ